MPRQPRFILPDVVHHVVARGVDRKPIFRNGFDKDQYLRRFARIATEERVLVHGFCLMDNHVHWLLTPTTPRALARLFQRVHTWWAATYNRRTGRTGHLFQNRYHSSPLGETHYWEALRYIELNPNKARLVDHPEDWPHSSARTHCTGQPDARIPHLTVVAHTQRRFDNPADWRFFLAHRNPQAEYILRRAIPSSRPCGSPDWIQSLEHLHTRRLALRPKPDIRSNRAQQRLQAS